VRARACVCAPALHIHRGRERGCLTDYACTYFHLYETLIFLSDGLDIYAYIVFFAFRKFSQVIA